MEEIIQPLSAKRGEVRFRKNLVVQHLGQKYFCPEEPDAKEILTIIKKRIENTRNIFQKLEEGGILLSPFLEIGAEKGQRAALLVNEFSAQGIALDLSLESLAVAPFFAQKLGFKKLPTLACADAYSLPFADNSFPFVFCFETLHHFPHPGPILTEIYRVLCPGGVFYFGEEPIRQIFNLGLWRRGYHLKRREKVLKMIGLLPFLSRIGKAETNHGILENEFSFAIWKKGFSTFDKIVLAIKPVFFGPKSTLTCLDGQWTSPFWLTQFLIALQGGGIEGKAVKKGKAKSLLLPEDIWRCPDCSSSVSWQDERPFCRGCQRRFAKKNGVFLFLAKALEKKLYE